MINWLVIMPLFTLLAVYSCRQERAQPFVQSAQPVVIQDSIQLLGFDKDILPILESRCSPCHFTGGKMYEKMPFDKPQTIANHTEGILKRFKEPELTKIKAYLDQVK